MDQEREDGNSYVLHSTRSRFAVWPHLTPGRIFSELQLPHPQFTDEPFPWENPPTGATANAGNTGPRPFLTKDDVDRWRDTEVRFQDLPEQDTGQTELADSAIEQQYRPIVPMLVYTTPGPPPAREFLGPSDLPRKGFWSGYGPVRYRCEYTGSPSRKSFQEFFPLGAIGQLPLRPGFEERVRQLQDGNYPLPKCSLGDDWDGNKLFTLADARGEIENRRLPTVTHAFTFAVYEVEKALNDLHPSIPAAAVAEFCESYDLYRHLCYFARALEHYGARLGRSPGDLQDEIHRALLCIWKQLCEYAKKERLTIELAEEPSQVGSGPGAPAGAPGESDSEKGTIADIGIPEQPQGTTAIRQRHDSPYPPELTEQTEVDAISSPLNDVFATNQNRESAIKRAAQHHKVTVTDLAKRMKVDYRDLRAWARNRGRKFAKGESSKTKNIEEYLLPFAPDMGARVGASANTPKKNA